MEQLLQLDTQWFLWINSHHCTFLDWVLWTASQSWCWGIATILFLALVPLRYEPKKLLYIAIGIALCFLLSDRISVLCFKNQFCRLRPCHAIENVRMFRTHCGGQYGFVSSHAANIFALAMFFSLWYRKRTRLKSTTGNNQQGPPPHRLRYIVPIATFGWALIVGYSRPYLGKHYPGDVICGAILGLVIGVAVWLIIGAIEKWWQHQKFKAK